MNPPTTMDRKRKYDADISESGPKQDSKHDYPPTSSVLSPTRSPGHDTPPSSTLSLLSPVLSRDGLSSPDTPPSRIVSPARRSGENMSASTSSHRAPPRGNDDRSQRARRTSDNPQTISKRQVSRSSPRSLSRERTRLTGKPKAARAPWSRSSSARTPSRSHAAAR